MNKETKVYEITHSQIPSVLEVYNNLPEWKSEVEKLIKSSLDVKEGELNYYNSDHPGVRSLRFEGSDINIWIFLPNEDSNSNEVEGEFEDERGFEHNVYGNLDSGIDEFIIY